MKKIIAKIVSILLLSTSIAALASCASTNGGVETIDYGAVYAISAENGTEVTVLDPHGKTVKTYGYAFVPVEMGDYTLVRKTANGEVRTTLRVADKSAPTIRAERQRCYASLGKLQLPKITVTDNYDASVSYKPYLVEASGETLIDDDFTFTACGEYNIAIKATDKAGNVAQETLAYTVVDKTSRALITVADFGAQGGVSCVYDAHGLSASYQTEKKVEDEQGAVKLSLDSSASQKFFRVNGALIEDITPYAYVYFKVYNDSNEQVKLSINGVMDYDIAPQKWTEVQISDYLKLQTSPNEVLNQTFSAKNVNGLMLSFNDDERVKTQVDLYMSNVYAISSTANDLASRIEALPETLTDDNMGAVDSIFRGYKVASTESRQGITNYDTFATKVKSYYAAKYPTTSNEGKAYLFDSPYGEQQVESVSGTNGPLAVELTAQFSTEQKQGEEGGSMKVTSMGEAWEVSLYFGFSEINTYGYTKLSFYIYYDFCDKATVNIWDTPMATVETTGKGAWQKVEMQLVDFMSTLEGCYIHVFFDDWGTAMTAGQSLYISPIIFS